MIVKGQLEIEIFYECSSAVVEFTLTRIFKQTQMSFSWGELDMMHQRWNDKYTQKMIRTKAEAMRKIITEADPEIEIVFPWEI